jgi:hypothetical protein
MFPVLLGRHQGHLLENVGRHSGFSATKASFRCYIILSRTAYSVREATTCILIQTGGRPYDCQDS